MLEAINTQSILSSIERMEPWSKQLEAVMAQDEKAVTSFIDKATSLYLELERSARHPRIPRTAAEAEKVRAIWIISAPGTYFVPEKEDRYKGKQWAWGADRARINFGFKIGRQIAEIRSGKVLETNLPKDLDEIRNFGPVLVYNGRSDENAALAQAVQVPWLRIPEGLGYPKDKVLIINPFIPSFHTVQYNLLDQVRTLHLRHRIQINSEDEIGIVVHASQAVRALYSLNASPTEPLAGLRARMFLMPTPETGIPEYPTQELRGLVYYRFIANPPIVENTPYPFVI